MTSEEDPLRKDVTRTLRQARQALQEGDRARARRLARECVRRAPRDERGWLYLAAVSEPRSAIAYAKRALELNPESTNAREAIHWLAQQPPSKGRSTRYAGPKIPPQGGLFIAPLERLSRWSPISPQAIIPALSLLFGLVVWYGSLPVDAGNPRSDVAPVAKASHTPTSTLTPTPTNTATPTATPTNTAPPTATPTFTPTATPTPRPNASWEYTLNPEALADEGRWIDVDLSEQRVTAYEGAEPVRSFVVSTGTLTHPTVTGQFRIYVKLRWTDMSGPGYYLPNVPYTMYFYRGYALHGTYWHDNFGTPMSHGCVNHRTEDAAWVFDFASVGTLVNVHP